MAEQLSNAAGDDAMWEEAERWQAEQASNNQSGEYEIDLTAAKGAVHVWESTVNGLSGKARLSLAEREALYEARLQLAEAQTKLEMLLPWADEISA